MYALPAQKCIAIDFLHLFPTILCGTWKSTDLPVKFDLMNGFFLFLPLLQQEDADKTRLYPFMTVSFHATNGHDSNFINRSWDAIQWMVHDGIAQTSSATSRTSHGSRWKQGFSLPREVSGLHIVYVRRHVAYITMSHVHTRSCVFRSLRFPFCFPSKLYANRNRQQPYGSIINTYVTADFVDLTLFVPCLPPLALNQSSPWLRWVDRFPLGNQWNKSKTTAAVDSSRLPCTRLTWNHARKLENGCETCGSTQLSINPVWLLLRVSSPPLNQAPYRRRPVRQGVEARRDGCQRDMHMLTGSALAWFIVLPVALTASISWSHDTSLQGDDTSEPRTMSF